MLNIIIIENEYNFCKEENWFFLVVNIEDVNFIIGKFVDICWDFIVNKWYIIYNIFVIYCKKWENVI